MNGHQRLDEFRRDLFTLVAKHLDDDLLAEGRQRIDHFEATGALGDRAIEQWRELLAQPVEEVRKALLRHDPDSLHFLQSEPFSGLLPPGEVQAIRDRHFPNAPAPPP